MIETNPESISDELETLILLALDARQEYVPDKDRRVGMAIHEDLGKYVEAKDRHPMSAYTFDASPDRLYSLDFADLIKHPFDYIGEGLEACFFYGHHYKWSAIELINRRPKGFMAAGKADKWGVAHYRTVSLKGENFYAKEYVAFNKAGKPIPTTTTYGRVMNAAKRYKEECDTIALLLSMIEDCHRSGSILATVKSCTEIKFPVSYGAHKDLFKMRDGPNNTPTKRKNPILHFCSKHLRGLGENAVEVKKHWKGTDSITIGDITLSLTLSEWDK